MDVKLLKSWNTVLDSEFHKEYFRRLKEFVINQYSNHTCYPPQLEIFKAFDLCDFESVKVVIIGQDPYHGYQQAHGLSFSVREGNLHPPSLKNIFKELEADIGKFIPISGDLTHWARQGVLLLNTILTVRDSEPGSHKNIGWERFTDYTIQIISEKKSNVVFLLWGGYAKKKLKLINTQKHFVLCSGHPSPLSANRGYWFGNKHFSKTNYLLEHSNQIPIDW